MNNLNPIFISMEESSQAIIFYLCTLLSEQSIIKSSQERKEKERGREREEDEAQIVWRSQRPRGLREKVDEKERQRENNRKSRNRVWMVVMLSGRL